MIDKERVKLMTKLAVFEQYEDKNVLRVSSYLKKDYITLRVIYTLIATTIAFFLLATVVLISRYNILLENLASMNVFKAAYILIGSWLVFEIIFGVIAYIFYSRRYKRSKEKADRYIADLNILDKMYGSGEK